MEFLVIEESEFAQFSETYKDANFWQSTSMAHLREWNGWKNEYVGVKDNGTLVAASMISYRDVFLGSTFAQAVRGFYIDYQNVELMRFFHNHLMAYLKSIKCMYFKIDPYLPYKERDENGDFVMGGFDYSGVVEEFKNMGYHHGGFLTGNDMGREPNWMFVCDVRNKSEEELLKSFHSQTKRSIQKAGKLGIRIREASLEDVDLIKKIMDHTANRRGFDDHDSRYYEGLLKTFGSDGTMKILFAEFDTIAYKQSLEQEKAQAIKELEKLEVASETANPEKHAKKVKNAQEQIELAQRKLQEIDTLNKEQEDVITLSVATFMTFGKEVLYLYGGSYDEYMKFNGSYALQWHMIRYAMEHHKERYNFYGISGDFRKEAEDYGIYEFKKGFHGTVEQLVGEFYYYVQPGKYKVYQALRKVKHWMKG